MGRRERIAKHVPMAMSGDTSDTDSGMKAIALSTPPAGFARGGRLKRSLAPAAWVAARWTARLRMLPDFVIIGAQKAGTTSLCTYLFRHPQVLPPRRKEIHFFDSPEYAYGSDWYRAHFPIDPRLTLAHRRAPGGLLTGEASPYYLAYPHAPRRLYEVAPNAKLVVMLRNPVDRALSHYHHQIRHGREDLSFEDAIRAEPERLAGELEKMLEDEDYYSYNYWAYSYVARGLYAAQLERWYEHFPKEQILVIRSEDFFRQTSSEMQKVTEHIGLQDFALPRYGKQNAGTYTRLESSSREHISKYFEEANQRLTRVLGSSWSDVW